MNFDEIQSGQRNDLVARSLRALLTPASWIYGAVVKKRNRDFQSGRKPIGRVNVPVICIGNLTTGGTGKTPVVCHFAAWLRRRDTRVSIISRGYRSDETGTNDEAKELADRLPDVPHVQNPERFDAARIAVDELTAEVILMDDGFQHRRFHRDLDFVVIDSTRPFGFGKLLPRGLLREPISELHRADAVILTRCDCVSNQKIEEIKARIQKHSRSGTPILRSCHKPKHLLSYPNDLQPIEAITGKRVACLSAIGNPTAFEQTVRDTGADVADHFQLGDHAEFNREVVRQIDQWLNRMDTEPDAIVCTHKDLVKIQTDRLAGIPVMAIQIDLEWIDDPSPLHKMIDSMVRRSQAN